MELGFPPDALVWQDPPSSCLGLSREHVAVARGPEALEPR